MTANALEGDREKCLAGGMDDYLSKPVKIEVLRLKLEEWSVSLNEKSEPLGPLPPPSSTKDVDEILDFSVLEGFRNFQQAGQPDLVDELINLFADDTTKRLSAIKQAHIDRDSTRIKSEAHNVKGAAGNIGALRMARLCGEVERAADQRDEAGVLIPKLQLEFTNVMESLSGKSQSLKVEITR